MDKRYSLGRYSLGSDNREVLSELHGRGELNAVVGSAIPVPSEMRCGGNLGGKLLGTVSVVSVLPARGELGASVDMHANVVIPLRGHSTLSSSVYGCKDVPGSLPGVSKLDTRIWGSKDIPASLEVREHLTTHVEGSKNITGGLFAFGALGTVLSATSQATETATFQLTIPPGGELRIDSDVFTVLLDGQNALHTQSGDWVEVSRELLRLLIESASGGQLEGFLVYTERYL